LEIHQSELYHPDCTPSWWGSQHLSHFDRFLASTIMYS